jgi:hypothetical protein
MPDSKVVPEQGYASTVTPAGFRTIQGTRNDYESVDWTETPDLRFPWSPLIYDRMRRSDAQIAALLQSIRLPIIGAKPILQTEDVRPVVAAFVKNQLGLDDRGRARRRRSGIVWSEHVHHALLMLVYGFMPFETVYEAGPPPVDLDVRGNSGDIRREANASVVDYELPPVMHHLRKLAPRMPRTLKRVVVSRDGGLAGIVQQPLPDTIITPGEIDGIFIPVDQIVMYVNDREGADWYGQSILRAPYKHWMIKDVLLRLGAQIVERNGMGVPIVTGGNDPEQAKKFAEDFRAGANAGGWLPEGATLALVGVTGSTKDELPLVKYHDEAIARSALAMFLQLGSTDSGSRALGETQVDAFLRSLMAVLNNIAETTTEHVIRDLVERNFGPDEAYPVLTFDDLTTEQTATVDGLVALAGAGLLGDVASDTPLKEDVRRRLGLPDLPAQPVEEPVDEQGLVDDTTADDEAVPADVMTGLSEWVEPARSEWEIRLTEVEMRTDLVESQTSGARNLRAYWTRGKGLAKWAKSAHPFGTLERLLRPYIKDDRKRKAVTASWYHDVFNKWPGSGR